MQYRTGIFEDYCACSAAKNGYDTVPVHIASPAGIAADEHLMSHWRLSFEIANRARTSILLSIGTLCQRSSFLYRTPVVTSPTDPQHATDDTMTRYATSAQHLLFVGVPVCLDSRIAPLPASSWLQHRPVVLPHIAKGKVVQRPGPPTAQRMRQAIRSPSNRSTSQENSPPLHKVYFQTYRSQYRTARSIGPRGVLLPIPSAYPSQPYSSHPLCRPSPVLRSI